MPLVDHGWGYSDGNVVDTVTYGHSDPWYTHTYTYTWSSQAVTLPSDGVGQAQADTTRTTSTATHAVAAPSPTRSPTQSPTSTTRAASQASTSVVTASPPPHATSLADEGTSAFSSGSGGGVSHSSGASFGIITGTPSPAITQALAGSSSSSTGEAVPTGPSRNLTGRGMGTGATVGIMLAMVPLTVGLVGVLCFAWRRRRRGRRRRESSFMQYPFLWRRDAASTATTSEVLTPPRAPAEWHTFRNSEAAESAGATTTTTTMTMVASGNGGGVPALNDKSELPVGHPLRFSPAFPLSSPILPSPPPPTPASVRESRTPAAPLPAVHDTNADQPPSPASTLLYAYAYPWDHLPPPDSRRLGRGSFGTVSVSYSNAMADSEVGSRPQSYSRY